MRFRHTILCLAVALSCLTHGSDMAYGQSPALLEAAKQLSKEGRSAQMGSYEAGALDALSTYREVCVDQGMSLHKERV